MSQKLAPARHSRGLAPLCMFYAERIEASSAAVLLYGLGYLLLHQWALTPFED